MAQAREKPQDGENPYQFFFSLMSNVQQRENTILQSQNDFQMRRFNTTALRQEDGSNKVANLMFGVGSKDLCLLCNSGRTD